MFLTFDQHFGANFKNPFFAKVCLNFFCIFLSFKHKLGDWKTAESWLMLKFFWSESFNFF